MERPHQAAPTRGTTDYSPFYRNKYAAAEWHGTRLPPRVITAPCVTESQSLFRSIAARSSAHICRGAFYSKQPTAPIAPEQSVKRALCERNNHTLCTRRSCTKP